MCSSSEYCNSQRITVFLPDEPSHTFKNAFHQWETWCDIVPIISHEPEPAMFSLQMIAGFKQERVFGVEEPPQLITGKV
jgi:hypothetical protein